MGKFPRPIVYTENLERIRNLVHQVSGPALFCLPENCLWIRVRAHATVDAIDLKHSIFRELATLAKQKNLTMHLGSVALSDGKTVWNQSIWITDQGEVKTSYKKIHLFDIRLAGRAPIRESDAFSAGESHSVVNHKSWKIGESICYDIRFAELFTRYAKEKVDVILTPAAFLKQTGEVHWHILLRARAIESQCYIVAAAQAGVHRTKDGTEVRESYGHSLIVSPWGEILAEGSGHGEEVVSYGLKKSVIADVRTQIPMHDHRRL